ncbi:MAG: peptidoglycan editing factor PgeF [Cellvibrio sp.]
MNSDHIIPPWPAPDNVRVCITTRAGGVSVAPYASNNFGLHVGDERSAVEANREALCAQLDLKKAPQWLEQIHGVKIVAAKGDHLVRTADGSYSTERGQACVVMTADCLPVFLCDKKGTQVAVLHCGWRSLAKGICAIAVKQFNRSPEDLLVYLGPAISQKHFEVGVDVLEAFFKSARNAAHADAIAGAFISAQRPLHFYADIYELARAELKSLGIKAIYGGDYCTYEQSEHFYSYRRDGVTGRMAHLIWLE